MQQKLQHLYKEFLNHLVLVDSVDRVVAWTTISMFVEAFHHMAFGNDYESALHAFFENMKENIEFQKTNKSEISLSNLDIDMISNDQN